MDNYLKRAQNIIAQTMADDIGPLFKPGMKLTFIARSPENPDCYMILSDEDDVSNVIGTIRRHQSARAVSR